MTNELPADPKLAVMVFVQILSEMGVHLSLVEKATDFKLESEQVIAAILRAMTGALYASCEFCRDQGGLVLPDELIRTFCGWSGVKVQSQYTHFDSDLIRHYTQWMSKQA